MEAFLQFFYAKYGMISESYALEMIGRPGYPKTYIEGIHSSSSSLQVVADLPGEKGE